MPEQRLREALLHHLLASESGDAARQRSARTFILCRCFFEEVQASPGTPASCCDLSPAWTCGDRVRS